MGKPFLNLGSKITRYFPNSIRTKLGEPFHKIGEYKKFEQTNAEHVFEKGYVYSWPGITSAPNLAEAWNLMFRINEENISYDKFEGELFKLFGSEMGWLVRMIDAEVPIVGVHSHILDIAGHAYTSRETELRSIYNRVDDIIGWVRSEADHLVILSDHGMQVSWIDETTGKHSMRALFSTTEDGPIPESVFDVRDWLSTRIGPKEAHGESAEFDTTVEQLEALGYK